MEDARGTPPGPASALQKPRRQAPSPRRPRAARSSLQGPVLVQPKERVVRVAGGVPPTNRQITSARDEADAGVVRPERDRALEVRKGRVGLSGLHMGGAELRVA